MIAATSSIAFIVQAVVFIITAWGTDYTHHGRCDARPFAIIFILSFPSKIRAPPVISIKITMSSPASPATLTTTNHTLGPFVGGICFSHKNSQTSMLMCVSAVLAMF